MALEILRLIDRKTLIAPNTKTELYNLCPGNYAVDKSHARVFFKEDYPDLSSYVGRPINFDASISFDPNNIKASQLEATADNRSLDLNDKKLQYRPAGPIWLDSDGYPEALFTSLSATSTDTSNITFIDDLTLKGEAKSAAMLVTFNGGADNLLSGYFSIGFFAAGSFELSEFGIETYTLIVGDAIKLGIQTEF